MCELLVARGPRPFPLAELWSLAERMERFGLAGYGWGVTWRDGGGRLRSHRDARAFCTDPAREALGANETSVALVHLRRPSRLSTQTLADTQPFMDPAGRFGFAHNGDLRDYRAARRAYAAAGRIAGRADSEVAARWLEDRWHQAPARALLPELHGRFGGQANLAALGTTGGPIVYAGNAENPLFQFRLADLTVAATGLYSLDRSLFRLAAPGARHRRLVRPGAVLELAAP